MGGSANVNTEDVTKNENQIKEIKWKIIGKCKQEVIVGKPWHKGEWLSAEGLYSVLDQILL